MARNLYQRSMLLIALFTAACGAGEIGDPEDTLDDDGDGDTSLAEPDSTAPEMSLALILEGADLESELVTSPVRAAPVAFDLLGIIYDAPESAVVEIALSNDGQTWSEWMPLQVEADEETYSGEQTLTEPATYYRLRSTAHPTYLSLELLDSSIPSEESFADDPEATSDPTINTSGSGLSKMATFRFDLGRVTKPWLWLLKSARRAGWSGRLAGSRTGLRTYAQQNQLYQAFLNGTGAPAFPPWGPSRHLIRNVKRRGRWSQAIDTQDVGSLISIAKRKGVHLHTPYSNEPWHVEATGYFRQPKGWNP